MRPFFVLCKKVAQEGVLLITSQTWMHFSSIPQALTL
jgi:hypothetical protein